MLPRWLIIALIGGVLVLVLVAADISLGYHVTSTVLTEILQFITTVPASK
jgi:hypothetical protein